MGKNALVIDSLGESLRLYTSKITVLTASHAS